MDKKKIMILPVIMLGLSCRGGDNRPSGKLLVDSSAINSSFVSRDSANKMISSYINSVNYTTTDTNLISVSLDAGQLKAYLLSDSTITGIKISLGHTLNYINAGGLNTLCGYKNTALTMIVSCYDAFGNFKFYSEGSVMDYSNPCPANCPPGAAASPLFTSNTAADD